MVVIRPPVWISILFTFIGTTHGVILSATACFIGDICNHYNLTCPQSHMIRVMEAEYRYKSKRNCRTESCNSTTSCCYFDESDCKTTYSPLHALTVYNKCSGNQTCVSNRAEQGNIYNCNNNTNDNLRYIHVKYSCIPGLRKNFTIHCVNTTSTEADINNGEEGQSKHLIIILVVVATVLVITAILVAVFILQRRRCKKPTGDDASKDELPNELINHDITSNRQSHLNYETVETSNYDEMNDESIATYAIPARKEKDDSAIPKDEKKNGGNGTIDEYDRIEFEKTRAVKMPNYDSVSVIEVKKVDDTYSHASSRPQPATAPTTNEYSHGQFVRNDSQSNDYTNKTTIVNEPRVADNYSHVDLDSDRTKRKPSNIVDEDSYHHIDLNKRTFASRNGEAVNVRTIHKSEEGSQTFKEDLQSLDVESEVWPIDNGNSKVSSQDQPLQDIMAVPLPDKYIEFKIGDIYDTPVRKDQQYTVVLKGNNEQLFNSIDAGSKLKSDTEESNGASKGFANGSDDELAKPTDV